MENQKRKEVIIIFDDEVQTVLLTEDQINLLDWLGRKDYMYHEFSYVVKDKEAEVI